MKTLLLDLRDAIWGLKSEIAGLRTQEGLADGDAKLKLMNELLEKDLLVKNQELKTKDEALEVLAAKMNGGGLSLGAFLFVFAFGLIFGLLVKAVNMI